MPRLLPLTLMVVVVTNEGDNLFVEAQGQPKTPMTPVSSTTFDVTEVQARVTFVRGESGRITKMRVMMNGEEHEVMKLPEFDPASVDLTGYAADYYSPELSTTYTLTVESGKMIARHFRTGDIHLNLSKPDRFIGDRWYLHEVVFVRDSNNKITGCKVSSGRVRDLKFEKVR